MGLSYRKWFSWLPWVAALVLAAEPALWLVGTWRAEFGPQGGRWIALGTLGLFLYSLTSHGPRANQADRRFATALLMSSAIVRLAAQIMAINILGAVTLVLDVYSLGRLFALHRRARAISPGWLALLFSLSLPVERVLQRVAGYGLQHISAAGACTLLKAGFSDVSCTGVRVLLAGQDVQVDLPCSGARGLVIIGALYALLACLGRPTARSAALGAALAVTAAVTSNMVRIAALAVGLAFPEAIGGIDLMAQPYHDLVGLVALALGATPLVLWSRATPDSARAEAGATEGGSPTVRHTKGQARAVRWILVPLAAAVLLAPSRPLDVSKTHGPPTLPMALGGTPATPQPLHEWEQRYFTQYGGGAARATYGDHALLVVATSAPLRHLHDPNECLVGAGHDVAFVGVRHGARPSAIYRTVDPEGRQWQVAVSYVSDSGQMATGVSEVAIRWLTDRSQRWRAIQRISPWNDGAADAFDAAVWAALDLPLNPSTDSLTASSHGPGASPSHLALDGETL